MAKHLITLLKTPEPALVPSVSFGDVFSNLPPVDELGDVSHSDQFFRHRGIKEKAPDPRKTLEHNNLGVQEGVGSMSPESAWLLIEKMVRPERFELPTFWFVARRSIQLS